MAFEEPLHLYFAESEDHCADRANLISQEVDTFGVDTHGWTTAELHTWATDRYAAVEAGLVTLSDDQAAHLDQITQSLQICVEKGCTCRLERIDLIAVEVGGTIDEQCGIRHRDGEVLHLPAEWSSADWPGLLPDNDYVLIDVVLDGTVGHVICQRPDRGSQHFDVVRLSDAQAPAYGTVSGIYKGPRNDEAWELLLRVANTTCPLTLGVLTARWWEQDHYENVAELLGETEAIVAELRALDEQLALELLTADVLVDEVLATVRRIH